MNGGIYIIQGDPDGACSRLAPQGRIPLCWASAIGKAHAGRPPEDAEVIAQRALQLLADNPSACTCMLWRAGRARRR